MKHALTFITTLLLAPLAVLSAADAPPTATPGGAVAATSQHTLIIKQEAQYFIVSETYSAVVLANGMLSQLDFPHKAGWIASGFLAGPMTIKIGREINPAFTCADITQPSPNVLVCSGEKVQMRYEFTPKEIICQATSRNDGDMRLLFTLSDKIEALSTENNHDEKKSAEGMVLTSYSTKELKAFYAESMLRMSGFFTLYARGEINCGVPPKSTQTLTFHLDAPTAAERERFAVPALYSEPLTVLSPMDWQVYQRQTRKEGRSALSGRCSVLCDRLEYRLSGPSLNGDWQQDWREIAVNAVTHDFNASLTIPSGGWYRCELRALKDGKPVASRIIEHVGVGEVFVTAGQSNSTNNGEETLSPQSGLVSTFSGNDWRPADDPQPGVHDSSFRGSFYPPLGDALATKLKVPVGFAVTGHGGTSVVQWYPGGELFNWTQTRILQFGPQGFRAVLWHQGESDGGTTATEYHDRLKTVIEESNRRAGWSFPWMVALATGPGGPRSGQEQLWAEGTAAAGPDTELLREFREVQANGTKGAHYTRIGLIKHGEAWAEKLVPWIEAQTKP